MKSFEENVYLKDRNAFDIVLDVSSAVCYEQFRMDTCADQCTEVFILKSTYLHSPLLID